MQISRKQARDALGAMGKSTVWRYLRIVDPSYKLAIAFCVSFLAFYANSNEEMGSITSILFFSLFHPINGCTCDPSARSGGGFRCVLRHFMSLLMKVGGLWGRLLRYIGPTSPRSY